MSTPADSLLGSLCRETCWLRSRVSRLVADLETTRHPGLCRRLWRELEALLERREQLQRLCAQMRSTFGHRDSLSLALLEELCSRPLVGSRLGW